MSAAPPRTGSPRARALAWWLGGASVVGAAGSIGLALVHGAPGAAGRAAGGLPVVLLFAVLGMLLALRQPANPIGWLLMVGGLAWLSNDVASILVTAALQDGGELSTALGVVAGYDEWIWPLGVLCSVGLPLLLFPDGHTRSPRWRWVLWAMVGGCAVTILCGALTTEPIPNPDNPAVPLKAPLAVESLAGVTKVGIAVGGYVLILSMATAIGGVLLRLRSATGIERQQLRWISSGAVLAIAGVLVFPVAELLGLPDGLVTFVFTLGFACLPLSFTVAILRYRLYDLDRVVSRTVTYSTVTGLLVLAYAGLVTAVSRLTPSGSSLAVAASTLAVAALFQPLRRRVQSRVDRRFNRARYDAEQTVDEFARRLREQVDLDVVRTDLLATARQTMQPAHAGLWLRSSGQVTP